MRHFLICNKKVAVQHMHAV